MPPVSPSSTLTESASGATFAQVFEGEGKALVRKVLIAVLGAHAGLFVALTLLRAEPQPPSQPTIKVEVIPPRVPEVRQRVEPAMVRPAPSVATAASRPEPQLVQQRPAPPVPAEAPRASAPPTLQTTAPMAPATSVPVVANAPVVPNASSAPAVAPAPPAPVASRAEPPRPPAAAAPVAAPPSAPRFDADYLQNPPPVYPPLSRRANETGTVKLKVFVEPSGLPGKVDIETGSGYERLDKAALAAVARWKFVPAMRGTEPIGAWVMVPIAFGLKNGGAQQ